MPGPLLYSTNVFLKYLIHQRYSGNVHYAWCSEQFDSGTGSAYSFTSLTPPTSNPADIYRDLKNACARNDHHNYKIIEQRTSLAARAVQWESDGKITVEQKDEILYMVQNADFRHWRPLVYVIPRHLVAGRLRIVPPGKRAGLGDEYIIEDLAGNEFDVVEV